MKLKWAFLAAVVAGLLVGASASFANGPPIISTTQRSGQFSFSSTSGELSMYLVGTWDNRGGVEVSNIVRLVNPGPDTLWAFVTFWKYDETLVKCAPVPITPNGSGLVFLGSNDNPDAGSNSWGAVKVLVTGTDGKPEVGLVGYRELEFPPTAQVDSTTLYFNNSEIRLQPVPTRFLVNDLGGTVDSELVKIKNFCEQPA